jgi:hypothetical protein
VGDNGIEAKSTVDTTTSQSADEVVETQSNRAFYIKLTIGLVFAVFVAFAIVDSFTNKYLLDAIKDFLLWVEENPSRGVFAFVIGKGQQPFFM